MKTICSGCNQEINPDVCWCGLPEGQHTVDENHAFVPMGCTCYRGDDDSESPKILTTVSEPVPDKLCVHVEMGVQMTGGWLFAAEDPPKAVGMCHECIVWCKENLLPATPWSEYAESQK